MLLSMMIMLTAPEAPAVTADSTLAPTTNPGSWVTSGDYPATAMRDQREGTTAFRLVVGVDGLPSKCDVIESSGHADLDTTTCRLLMERARFKPAHDERGQPAAGTYSNRIRWQIPDDYEKVLASAGFQVDDGRESWPRGPRVEPTMSTIDAVGHYPPAARAAREEGDVRMMLAIDAAGKVTRCDVTETSMSADLDTTACDLLRKEGQFRPALDSNGKPVRGALPALFRWVLPRDSDEGAAPVGTPPPIRKFPMAEPGMSSVSILVGPDGQVSDCQYRSTGAGDGELNPCDQIGGKQRYIPFVDANGRPVAKRITLRTDLLVVDEVAAGNASPE